jgi:hypothetical protein
LGAVSMAQEPLDDPWVGVNLKLEHASFHLEGMGKALQPPERTGHSVAIESTGAIVGGMWARAFYAHLDAFLSATRSVPELIRCCFGADNHPTISQWFTNLDEDEKNRRRAFEREFKADLTAFRNLPLSTARHISEHRTGAPPVSVTVTGRFGVTYQGGPTKPIPMTETQKLPDEYAFLEKRTLVRPMWTDFEIDGRPLFETCREYLGSAQALAAKARTLAQQVHGERKLTPPPSDM